MRLNGWMRIGIVLSILWMTYGTFWFWQQQGEQKLQYVKALRDLQISCAGENDARRFQGRPELECPSKAEIDQAWAAPLHFWQATILPGLYLVLAWVLIGIGYVSVRWIRAGFKRA
jgi:hypothetical protein